MPAISGPTSGYRPWLNMSMRFLERWTGLPRDSERLRKDKGNASEVTWMAGVADPHKRMVASWLVCRQELVQRLRTRYGEGQGRLAVDRLGQPPHGERVEFCHIDVLAHRRREGLRR